MRFTTQIYSLFLKFHKVRFKDIVIDHHKFLGQKKNSITIYDKPPINMILSPFNVSFEAMDRLLMVYFEEDPFYYGIELQVLKIGGKSYPLVIMYRKDDLIDFYHNNDTAISNRKKSITNLIKNTSFNQLETLDYKFDFDEMGLNCYLYLIDKMENEVEIKIKENFPNRKLNSILTPIYAVDKNPQYFPIVYLNNFNMVIKKDTEIFVKINGDIKKPAELPVKIENQNYYLARYSLNPISSVWNKNYSGILNPIIINVENVDPIEENLTYELLNNKGNFEIKKVTGVDELNHSLSFEFSPAIPNLLSLKSDIKIKGKFSLIIDNKEGIFAGIYQVTKKNELIQINIHPTKGWQLFPGKLWLKTYRWIANIEILDDLEFKIQSNWIRS